MKAPPSRFRSREGALMVLALLVVLAGAVVLAGWAQLLATRAVFAESASSGQNRRIALENSRSIARGYLLANMISNAIPATNIITSWGNITISPSTALWTSSGAVGTNDSAYKNPFSPMERWGYYSVVSAILPDGSEAHAWTFLIRTRSPIAAGYPLVLHKGCSRAGLGGLTYSNQPHIDYIDYTGGRSETNVSGFSGIPQIPMTSVTNSYSPTNAYLGYFGAPVSGAPAGGPIFGVTTNSANGTITLDLATLDDGSTNSLVRYEVPAAAGNATIATLVIQGTATATDKAVHIVATNNTALTRVVLGGANQRRLYFNRSGPATMVLSTSDYSSPWPIGITLSGTELSVTPPLTISGGIRTDSPLGGTVTLTPNSDPGALDAIGDRIMWIEDFRTP